MTEEKSFNDRIEEIIDSTIEFYYNRGKKELSNQIYNKIIFFINNEAIARLKKEVVGMPNTRRTLLLIDKIFGKYLVK